MTNPMTRDESEQKAQSGSLPEKTKQAPPGGQRQMEEFADDQPVVPMNAKGSHKAPLKPWQELGEEPFGTD